MRDLGIGAFRDFGFDFQIPDPKPREVRWRHEGDRRETGGRREGDRGETRGRQED